MRLAVLLICVSAPLSLAAGPSRPPKPIFAVGKDTTFVDGPRDADGYIDYAAAINRRLGRGVRPKDNAVVLLWRAFGPRADTEPVPPSYFAMLGMKPPPEKGDYVIPLRQFGEKHLKLTKEDFERLEEQLRARAIRVAWNAKELPRIAAWVKVNEKPLAVVREACRRKNYFAPVLTETIEGKKTELMGARLPTVQRCREAAELLVARALLRAAEGRTDKAWRDLLLCDRIGRLVQQGPTLIEALAGMAIRRTALDAIPGFLHRARPGKARLARYLADLGPTPASAGLADKVDFWERCLMLDAVQHLHRHGLPCLFEVMGPGSELPFEMRLLPWMWPVGVDYVPALRGANKWYARNASALRTPNRAARAVQLKALDHEFRSLRASFVDREPPSPLLPWSRQLYVGTPQARGKRVGEALLTFIAPAMIQAQHAADRFRQRHLNVQIVLALETYHRDHESYPKKLSALAPKYLKTVPKDLFSGKALVYKPYGKCYLLYSIGPDEEDEQGEGDDIAVRMPPSVKR
jgi:hypothetical protein